ncbi:MAG: hypothetical protein LBJ59_12235 [Zoogloeaceae bacterium]|jgi:hypothetical protein|nr:hypothetical protein [Zoogloeaceae bacterium]
MIIDKFLQVSDKQAVTATAASTDVIDLGQANPNVGVGGRLSMVITVGEAATASGAATVVISVQDSADNATFADIIATGAIPKAALTLGAQVVLPMPPVVRRYVRVNYTVAAGPLTAGKFSAQLVTGYTQNTPYPDSPNIS